MIEYTQPWQVLDVDVSNALNPNFNAEQFRAQSDQANCPFAQWYFRDNDMLEFLNKDWLEYVNRLGIPVSSFMMLYRDPYYVHPGAHVDLFWSTHQPSIYSINWVISPDDDSFMTWYDVPFDTGTFIHSDTDIKYQSWPLEDVDDKEFARYTIGNKLTLLSTALPHNIIVNKQPRWVISLRFPSSHYVTNNITDWQSAVDYYADTLDLVKT
jgi:hypothetical protein